MEQPPNWLETAHQHLLRTDGERWRITRHGVTWTFAGYLMQPVGTLPWSGCNGDSDVRVGDVLMRVQIGTMFVVVAIELVPDPQAPAYLRVRCIPCRVPDC